MERGRVSYLSVKRRPDATGNLRRLIYRRIPSLRPATITGSSPGSVQEHACAPAISWMLPVRAYRAGRSRIERIVAQPRRKRPRRCAGVRSFLSHLITIMRPVIMTISMVIKKIAIRLVSARGNPSPSTDPAPVYVHL